MAAEVDQWRLFWEQQTQEYFEEEHFEPVAEAGWKYRTFVSRSNGRGRKPRGPRDIELAVNESGKTIQLADVPRGGLDVVAEALLGHLTLNHSTYEEFLIRLRKQP